MNIEQAFTIRQRLVEMSKTKNNKVLAHVLINILSGHYDRLENAKEIAEDDIEFLKE